MPKVRHARRIVFPLAEATMSSELFAGIFEPLG